jgi:hypothetical protein
MNYIPSGVYGVNIKVDSASLFCSPSSQETKKAATSHMAGVYGRLTCQIIAYYPPRVKIQQIWGDVGLGSVALHQPPCFIPTISCLFII